MPKLKDSWREEMSKLANRAYLTYNSIVRQNPDFVTYFRQITPLNALSQLPLDSRPAKRRQRWWCGNTTSDPIDICMNVSDILF